MTSLHVGLDRPTIQVPRPQYNLREGWLVVPEFPTDDSRHNTTTVGGRPGFYQLTFVFGVPGKNVFRDELNLSDLDLEGDSLVVFPDNVETLHVQVDELGVPHSEIVLHHNANRRLATASIRVQAASLLDAEKRSYEIVSGFFSYLSYSNDVPIDVSGYRVTEEATGSQKAVFGMLGEMKPLLTPDVGNSPAFDERYRRLFAAYREGMNATNVFYQALSFSKAVEGCRLLREQKNEQANSVGQRRLSPSLKIPATVEQLALKDDALRQAFQPFVGRKFSTVIDELRPLVRNAIAHLDPTQVVLDVDHFDDIAACERAVAVLRYIARALIRFELEHV